MQHKAISIGPKQKSSMLVVTEESSVMVGYFSKYSVRFECGLQESVTLSNIFH